jgi:hypothetical protein
MANDRSKTPTLKSHGPMPSAKRGGAGDDEPTSIYDSGNRAATPIRSKSMKTPGQVSGPIPLPDVEPLEHSRPQVKLRALSEVAANQHTPQRQLGYLAPPRDPVQVRARRTRDFVVWGSVCVILACVVALGIWFIAK